MDAALLYEKLLLPLLRLCAAMCLGLFAASVIESLHWTRTIAGAVSPLARLGHLRSPSAASFALAFFSPSAANALLAEAHAKGEISRRETIFANIFNSTPSVLVHLPTLLSLTFAFLGTRGLIYVGLILGAAALRTLSTALAGRLLLAAPLSFTLPEREEKRPFRETFGLTLGSFKKRAGKLLLFTIPVYCLFFIAQNAGLFKTAQDFLAQSGIFSFLNPEAAGITALYLLGEGAAAMSAAACLADASLLPAHEIIMALLIGNILSSPLRALRHQLPSYAGFFAPPLALMLVLTNQTCRALSLALTAAAYYFYAF
ncbi:MAG: hypothetical protein LBN33_03160 [Desulfovibrio sp.]|jgi:hypothetical protein|nr:hypothetical protein [Desulfovibrio sp.]